MRSARWIALASIISGLPACAPPSAFPMRAEIDRGQWTVRDCASGKSYRAIFTSAGVVRFYELEANAGLRDTQSEPAVLEFEAVFLPPLFPWSDPEAVGVRSATSLIRGDCATQPPSRTP
jgi:hypothetical protein